MSEWTEAERNAAMAYREQCVVCGTEPAPHASALGDRVLYFCDACRAEMRAGDHDEEDYQRGYHDGKWAGARDAVQADALSAQERAWRKRADPYKLWAPEDRTIALAIIDRLAPAPEPVDGLAAVKEWLNRRVGAWAVREVDAILEGRGEKRLHRGCELAEDGVCERYGCPNHEPE